MVKINVCDICEDRTNTKATKHICNHCKEIIRDIPRGMDIKQDTKMKMTMTAFFFTIISVAITYAICTGVK